MNEHERNSSTASDVQISRGLSTSRERVFDAWLHPDQARRFLFRSTDSTAVEARIDARIGGAFQITVRRGQDSLNHIGIYHAMTRPHSLSFSLSVPRYSLQWSRVRIELLSVPGGCELNLFHTQLRMSDVESYRAGWLESLVYLQQLLAPKQS